MKKIVFILVIALCLSILASCDGDWIEIIEKLATETTEGSTTETTEESMAETTEGSTTETTEESATETVELPSPTPVLVDISLESLPKTEYKVGEWLDISGGVIACQYLDGSIKRINLVNSYVYGWTEAYEAGPGQYTLTVMYKENGILAETTFVITIIE